ncbi:VOC family protein [Pseudaestuariivita atlantica]|uniref:Glyoxalase n=1 Tax=Pseudaestuariivita atlantica TaxID=1317121 RepID=A0A0L1JQN0_9RHOB|nr:VOC family protein [Pseudaestuariivita atlantica]KNG94017.1 glyoxalase [Pseudaestuariivita atlantica]
MQLGAFSVSLGVKDLARSKAFYETLGFQSFGGSDEHGFTILKNGDVVIGLFQGMFDGPMLTFNPGWDQSAQPVDPFTDVRELKERLREAGFDIQQEQGAEVGPASFVVVDPDGLPILFDQHR